MVLELGDTYVSPDSSPQAIEKLVQAALQTSSPISTQVLTGGITNQLVKAVSRDQKQKCLVRVFGRGTATFIDREHEYRVHLRLAELGMAAPLFCKFGNGLVYAWAEGKPLTHVEMAEHDVALMVARKLGKWHHLLDVSASTRPASGSLGPADKVAGSSIYTLVASWIPLIPEEILPLSRAELAAELEWFEKRAPPSKLVVGHNDLLCGNILLDKGDVSFIDYEYAQQCPRAYDIANHFVEWQGYDCEIERIPDLKSELVGEWLAEYLKAANSSSSVDELRREVQAFYGLPGFYWSVWSAIQSTQSDIDFNYGEYAKLRFGEYLRWKEGEQGAC